METEQKKLHDSFQTAVQHHQAGRLQQAEETYSQILEADPRHADALHFLGVLFHHKGNHAKAFELITKAIEINPSAAYYYNNLGSVLAEQNDIQAAEENYRKAVELMPTYVEGYSNLAKLYYLQEKISEAISCYQKVLELDPGHADARHMLAALKGERLEGASQEYVRKLFDENAERYDQHLADNLQYKVPILLREAVGSAAGVERASWKVLDIGCGTGLCGPLFRDLADRLVGVDLSPRMIEKAGEKKVYDDLRLQDLIPSLRSENGTLDLVLAADVFTYIGDLAEVFAACSAALRDGGHFAFSVESFEGESFTLRQTGRFAHSSAYIEKIAEEYAFSVEWNREDNLRLQNTTPMPGYLFVLRRGNREHN